MVNRRGTKSRRRRPRSRDAKVLQSVQDTARSKIVRASYDANRCLTTLYAAEDRPATFAINDKAMAYPQEVDWRLAVALFGGTVEDWRKPGFAASVVRPLVREGCR